MPSAPLTASRSRCVSCGRFCEAHRAGEFSDTGRSVCFECCDCPTCGQQKLRRWFNANQ